MSELINLASAYKGHGLKGEVKLNLHNKSSDTKLKSKKVLIKPLNQSSGLPEQGQWCSVEQVRGKDQNIVKLSNFSSLSELEPFLPFELFIKKEELAQLNEGEYFIFDLIGLTVFEQDSGEELGKVASIREIHDSINLIIKGKEEIELPFKENFFPKVDIEEKTIYCLLPEYI